MTRYNKPSIRPNFPKVPWQYIRDSILFELGSQQVKMKQKRKIIIVKYNFLDWSSPFYIH